MNLSPEASRFVPLVTSLASKMRRTLVPEMDEQELVNLGLRGLAQGFAQYKPRQGLTQRDYLTYRIREALYTGVKTHHWPTNERKEKYHFLKKTNELLLNFHLSAEGTVKRSMKAETAEVLYLLKLLATVAWLCKTENRVENSVTGDLESHEHEFLDFYYDQDLDLATVSEKMSISEAAASRFHLKLLDKMADKFCGVHE